MWTVIFSVLIAFALSVSLVAIFLAARSVVAVQELRQHFQLLNASAPESLKARVSEIESTLEVLANRVKMQRVRTAAEHATKPATKTAGEPDPAVDPEGWRNWQNKQLRAGVKV